MNVSTFYRALFGTFLIGIIIIVLHISINGGSEDPVRIVIRYTARIAAFLFAIIFASSSVHHLIKSNTSASLVRYRPHLGIVFAVVHTLHLMSLVYLQYKIHPVFSLAKSSSLFAGGTAYLLMYLMLITTHPGVKLKMSLRSWRIIHLIGLYWIWVIFFNSYFKKVVNHSEGYVLLALLSIGLVLRILGTKYKLLSKS